MSHFQQTIQAIDAVLTNPDEEKINEATQLLEKAEVERADLVEGFNIARVLLHGISIDAIKVRITVLLKSLNECFKGNTEFLHWVKDNTADKIYKLDLVSSYGRHACEERFDKEYAQLRNAVDTDLSQLQAELSVKYAQKTREIEHLQGIVDRATSFMSKYTDERAQQTSASASTAQGAAEGYDFKVVEKTLLFLMACNRVAKLETALTTATSAIARAVARPEIAQVNEAIQSVEKAEAEAGRTDLAEVLNIAIVLLQGLLIEETKERTTTELKSLNECFKRTEFSSWMENNSGDKRGLIRLVLVQVHSANINKLIALSSDHEKRSSQLTQDLNESYDQVHQAQQTGVDVLGAANRLTDVSQQVGVKRNQLSNEIAGALGTLRSDFDQFKKRADQATDFFTMKIDNLWKEYQQTAQSSASTAATTDIPAVDEIKRRKLG